MMTLAPYACKPEKSRGRLHSEESEIFSALDNFRQDRKRIIYSRSFRRLEAKTQVFINNGFKSFFRTRLTHSLEVSQIARSMARKLFLSEDLVEAISLAHDLGHSPFGHAGQDEINLIIDDFGLKADKFEHNLHGLRIVDLLEKRYSTFSGLNLCFETREGILKHCSRKNAEKVGDVGIRFINSTSPSLEAQLVNYADEIAYNTHDIDDGINSGLISLLQLRDLYLFGKCFFDVTKYFGYIDEKILIAETIRKLLNLLMTDLIENSSSNIRSINPKDVEEVRLEKPMISFSESIKSYLKEIKEFLYLNLYRNHEVISSASRGRNIIRTLFKRYLNDRSLSNDNTELYFDNDPIQRIIDYIVSMTDREAIWNFENK